MKDTENRPPSRKRRKWGSVIVRRDADGNPASFQARYVNPLDPPKKVGRNFGLEYETEAYKWLDVEHYLVALHNKGIRQWVHPSQRGADTMPVFCQVVIGQCGVSFPSEKAVGFSPVRNWPVIARVLLFHCIRA